MNEATASIIVAVIASLGSIIGILINKTKNEVKQTREHTELLREENRQDHAIVAGLLNKVIHDVHQIDAKLDDHIESHNENLEK